jgi:hypothetical protein
MVTQNIYFEYIKILCNIFITYIVPMLQVCLNHLFKIKLYFLKLLQMTFNILLITCNKKLKFNIILTQILE